MTGSDVEERKFLRNFHVVLWKASDSGHYAKDVIEVEQQFSPEYTCLQSMMLEPQNPTMWNSMALVYMMTGRIEDALDAIERSLDIDSGDAWTWSIWGDILDQLDNHTESERAYRMAFELGTREPHVLRQLIQKYIQRSNIIDALMMFEYLLPLCPNSQPDWDQYTTVLNSIQDGVSSLNQ